MKSIFIDEKIKPATKDLKKALGTTFPIWQSLEATAKELYPAATSEWKYSGIEYGWSFRIKDKKRVIIYLLPRDLFFKVAFVFGQKAAEIIFRSDISETIKTALRDAKPYAEGRGIRLDVKDTMPVKDIEQLIRIKISS